MNDIKVRTPAKLIVSGEHAVIYGYPALAVAINRYIQVTARFNSPLHYTFDLAGIDFKRRLTRHALKRLKHKVTQQYEQYKVGTSGIKEVLKKPFELALFTAISVIDKVKQHLPMGFDVHSQTNIPIGCGLGSSAASVVSLIFALSQLLHLDFKVEDYIQLGIESENLQHGYSSGLDVNVVYHGGAIYYQHGSMQKHNLQNFSMQLINTGSPQSTTGECVSHVQKFFKESSIGDDFSQTTDFIAEAVQNAHQKEIIEGIQRNHTLLHKIGVVPEKVSSFIQAIEKRQGAAKICGAGSITGDTAGMVLIVCEENISDLAEKFGYHIFPAHIENTGTHVL